MNIDIITYWNVETLYYVFNGVASIMGSATFTNIIRMVFLLALMVGIFSYGSAGKTLELATWFIQALLLTTLLNLPVTRVLITDKTAQEPPRVVANVPLALAVIAQSSTMVFSKLTDIYETVFSVPGELGLAQGDLGFGHRILKQVNNISIRDPGLRSDLMQFIKECTLYDIKDGTIASQEIIGQSATSPWFVIFSKTSPARFATYNTLPGTVATPPVTATCPEVAQVLALRVGDGIDAAQKFYGRTLFPRAQTDAAAQALFVGAIGTSYDWVLNNSQNASDAMRQSMFNNLWKDAGTELPTLLGDATRVAEVNALMGSAQAAGQANTSNSVLSQLAQENLPHMRNWIEAILYSLFPVVLLLAVFMSAQGAWKMLGGYAMALVWIGLWPLLFAIINGLSLLHLKHKTAALNLASNIPFQLTDVFDATLSDEQAAIGYMVVLVPFIAGAIVKMGQGGILSMADKMGASFSSAGASVGANAAMGNFSSGQVGMDTASVNTTAMHKYDSNIGLIGGGSSMSLSSGGMMMTQGGHAARANMLNRFSSSLAMHNNRSSNASQEAGRNLSASAGTTLSNQDADAATLSRLHRAGDARSIVHGAGLTGTVTQSGGTQGADSRSTRRAQQYADGSNLSTTVGANTALSVGAQANAGASANWSSGGAGRGSSYGGVDAEEKRLLDTMKGQGVSQEKQDAALKNLRQSKSGGQPAAAQRPEVGFSVGGTAGANLGLRNTNTASATTGKSKAVTSTVTLGGDSSKGAQYSETGSVTDAQRKENLSTNDKGISKEATRTHVVGYANASDAGLRKDSSMAKCAHPPKFGHFVKIRYISLGAQSGVKRLVPQKHLSFALPV